MFVVILSDIVTDKPVSGELLHALNFTCHKFILNITTVPSTKIRHTGLDPVSSNLLNNWIPDQQKTLSGMTGLFFDFHVSRPSMLPSGFY